MMKSGKACGKAIFLVAIVCAFMSGGCSTSSVRVQSGSVPFSKLVTSDNPLAEVKLSMAPSAQSKYENEALLHGFDADKLLAVVWQALEERSLLQFDRPDGLYVAEIIVREIDIKPAANRANWGILAGSDSISADLVVFRKDTEEKISSAEINVNHLNEMSLSLYRWSPERRMDYIYRSFAEQVGRALSD